MISTRYCPECDRSIVRREDPHSGSGCPHCGSTLSGDDERRWVNVARVANLAEAGFLADELAGEDIEARIYQCEDFNALTDRWTVSYLIQSPPRDAQSAAARVRRHVTEMEASREPAEQAWGDERPTLDPLFWRPMALVVLAGMASFALGQRFAADRDPPRPPRNSLSNAITAIGRPLVTEPLPGMPRHRLSYQSRQQTWYLDTDSDGDGRYESQQRFQVSGTGW